MRFSFSVHHLLLFNLYALGACLPQGSPKSDDSTVHQVQPFFVPSYAVSAGGYSSAARGWNSWGLQANPLTNYAGWVFDDYHFLQQCGLIATTPGFDYYCSIDDGWSAKGGDHYGRTVPDDNVFSTTGSLKNFSDQIHDLGLKVGIYLLPGALQVDAGATIENTSITIGDILDTKSPIYNSRQAFNWSADGVQQWHDSVVRNLASMGVDMIKLDFLTPGSPHSGKTLPADTSQSVTKYRSAINTFGNGMRLHISYALNRTEPEWDIWKSNADTLRLDTDVNNVDSAIFVAWKSVQRAIEAYRVFITQQTLDPTRRTVPITIRPDMDNTYLGNSQRPSGLSDVQRYSMAIHWIGAGANLITGSDQTTRDQLGYNLTYDPEAMDIAAFTSQYPMQPRNPSGWGTLGDSASVQLQAWIAGPSADGVAVVVLANYGPDEGAGGFGLDWDGVHLVTIPLPDLGIGSGMRHGADAWFVRQVWGGGGSGGPDHTDIGIVTNSIGCKLGPGESVLYKFTKAMI